MKQKPLDITLYNKVKAEAKSKFKVWPSAYASGWLVREYKRRGGKYTGKRMSSSINNSKSIPGLSRWFDEKWIDVCKLPKKVSCGRPKLALNTWKKNYPYCRPSKRINSNTPKTASELSMYEIKKRCSRKRKSPLKRLTSKSVRKSKKNRKSRNKSRNKSKRVRRTTRRKSRK